MKRVAVLATLVACAPAGPDRRAPLDVAPFVTGEVLIELEPGHGAGDVEALGARMGAYAVRPSTVDGWWFMAIDATRDPREAARELADRPEIARAHANQRRIPFRRPSDARYPDQWSHRQTEAEGGWEIEIGDPRIVVAIIGTGVAIEHQDLRTNVFINPREIPGNMLDDDQNGFVDDTSGWDFADHDGDARPFLSERPSFEERAIAAHETMVAGIMGASGNNGVGIAGAAWDVSILPIRFDFTAAQSAEAIDYARRMGARAVNLSYGSAVPGEIGRDPFEEETINRAFGEGVVVVAAAGNDGVIDTHYPAAYPNVLATGATRRDGQRALFSNYGDWVDVSAPGEEILSTFIGGSFNVGDGTSFSAPYVAGVAALVAARHPTWSAQDIRRTILYTGDKTYPDFYVGTRVNVRRAVERETPPRVFARFVTPLSRAQFAKNGVASFDGFAVGDSFVIESQAAGTTEWLELATGTSTIGEIARFGTGALDVGEYRFRLRCTAGNEVDVDYITVVIQVGSLPGWPAITDARATAPGIAGDIDRDGAPDVIAPVVRRNEAELHVLRTDASAPAGWPVRLPSRATTAPVLADLDGDGSLEIVIGLETGLFALTAGGQTGPSFPAIGAVRGLALGDLDGDGRLDVVATEDTRAWALRPDGSTFGGWPITLEPGLGAPAVGDFDGDGTAEIAIVGERQLHLRNPNGASRLGAPVFIDGLPGATIAAGDLDGDGRAEILVARDRFREGRLERPDEWTRDVHVIDLDGRALPGWPNVLARSPMLASEEARMSAGDLDGDGRPEVLVGVDSGELWAFDRHGAALPRWPAEARARQFSVGAVGDVDGDGAADLVTIAPGVSSIVAFDSGARAASGFPLTTRSDGLASPIITDLDQDGNVDVVVPGAGVEAFALPRAHDLASGEWPLPGRDSLGSRFLPPRFALEISARGPRDLALVWREPNTIPPARYRVERDKRPIATTTMRELVDVVADPAIQHTYRVLAIDLAGNLLGRSIDVTTTAEARWCEGLDGRACDDGDACTSNDACAAGECAGGAESPDGTRCDDGDACTRSDACLHGSCTSMDVVACPATTGCAGSVCDPATGACVATPRANGEACDDENPCSTNDVCWRSICRGDDLVSDGTECDDDNPCTAPGTCRGGACDGAFPLATGTPCDDGNTCTLIGHCVDDRCVDQAVLGDGTACDDGDKCSSAEVCTAGTCGGARPVRCGGDSQCVAGSSCDPRTGECRARQLPDHAPCDDGSACTQWDVCIEGMCSGEAPVICAEATASCDPTSGACVAPVVLVEPSGCGCATSDPADAAALIAVLAALVRRRARLDRARPSRAGCSP